jgi:8-oxo-dGTP pyrophosphatase MutT (NUDIX family)/predicted transcriptional regulator
MQDLHIVQIQILRELLYNPKARFAKLNIAQLSNDHFSYHLKTLLKEEFIIKEQQGYRLTAKGKEFANMMDTDQLVIEKQGKISVFVVATKKQEGQELLLVQTRTKEPYFGYMGFVTGKVRFGETIMEAAKRELLEETGLTAKLTYKYLLHEHIYSKDHTLLEDKFFHVIHAFNTKGTLQNTRDGKNEWMTERDFKKKFKEKKKIFYDELDILKWLKNPPKGMVEKEYVVEKF